MLPPLPIKRNSEKITNNFFNIKKETKIDPQIESNNYLAIGRAISDQIPDFNRLKTVIDDKGAQDIIEYS